uniref:Eukaryotic translation initiation factor 2-alpha kinase 1 n=1 Tax=Caligus clemensi TaxID=344056 RepID=C1C2V5_CALCM|nr:Eukaryotic translation initiation factor 2-alpha kinase 1 [Caligus clemensi]
MNEDFSIPSDIAPITTMDRGGSSEFPYTLQRAKGGGAGSQYSMSIIVESLLDLLLSFYEQNDHRRSELLGLIWESLVKVFPCSNSVQSPGILHLRGQYQNVFKRLIKISQSKLGFKEPLRIDSNGLSLHDDISHLSRCHSEFDELEYLAKGGFGSVFKVRNKLDHQEYAIKKILLKCDKDWKNFSEVTKEVIMLAKLSHPNIVSYKTAWIEPTSIIDHSLPRKKEDEETSSSVNFSFSEQTYTEESQSIVFQENSPSSQKNPGFLSCVTETSLSFSSNQNTHDFEDNKNFFLPSSCLKMGAVLYLQMELCEKTLRERMNTRASSGVFLDSKVNTHIFTQILEGVSYIHSQGIIPRGLKPKDIFICNKDNIVRFKN